MKNLLLACSLVAVLACAATDIATDPQYVPAGTAMIDSGVEIYDEGTPTGRNWVIVDEDIQLPPEAPTVAPDDVASGDKNAVVAVWGAVEPFVPDGPWKGLGMGLMYFGARMFGKRYRQNWGKALANAGGAIGSVVSGDLKSAATNVGGALRMAASAEGVVHTTEDPAELERVAARKRAQALTEA